MNTDQAFAQGARCGHIEGKARCGVYVQDEEYDAAMVAADAQTWRDIEGFTYSQIRNMWEAGYRHGYTLGASGESLEKELQIG